MTTVRAISAPELVELRKQGQFSKLYIAGTESPPVVFACLVNQVATTNDRIAQVIYDGVTSGAYGDIIPGQTLWLGSTAGAYDLGIARVRKAATSTIIYIGEGSDIDWENADNKYITIVDEMGIWAKHPRGAYVDYDVAYSNQHTVFDPIVLMGSNPVLYVDNYPVDVTFPEAANSSVYGSTIATWAWTATAGTFDNAAISAPTLTISSYPSNGLIRVALTLTSAAGKSFTGYRYIRVYDATHAPVTKFNIESVDGSITEGGWSFDVTLYGDAALTQIRDRSPITLFARDYYAGTLESFGLDEGRENTVCSGWVDGETIDYNPVAGTVSFTVKGASAWLRMTTAFPLALQIPLRSPTLWSQMPSMTPDRAIFHLLHYRSTVSAIMDIKLTGDSRMSLKFELAQTNVLEQMREIASKIFAVPFVDQYGCLSVNILPQYIPEADRSWAVLQEIEDSDWIGSIAINRRVVDSSAMVSLVGRKASASGNSVSYYSLANGHIYKHFGGVETIDDVLVSTQTQSNELAGLHAGYRNMELSFVIRLAANNRMVTMMPKQFFSITINSTDNERGIEYIGNIVPVAVSYIWDFENLFFTTEITCEAETFPELAINGDIPNDASGVDLSIPPLEVDTPEMPGIEELAQALPATAANANYPRVVVIASSTHGVLYTENFHEDEPEFVTMNDGLTEDEYQSIGRIVKTDSGAMFLMCDGSESAGYNKIYFASGVGAVWSLVAESDDPPTKDIGIFRALGVSSSGQIGVQGGVSYTFPDPFNQASFFVGSSSGIGTRYAWFQYLKNTTIGGLAYTTAGWYLFTLSATGLLGSIQTGTLFIVDGAGLIDTVGVNKFDLTMSSANGSHQFHAAACGTQPKVFYWNDDNAGYGLFDGITESTSTDIDPRGEQALSPSPTGEKIMASNYASGNYQAHRSGDGGTTWESLTAVVPLGMSVFVNCGDNSRWIFGGGTNLKVTVNFGDLDPNDGTSYYQNREGNLSYIAPLIDITHILYVSG